WVGVDSDLYLYKAGRFTAIRRADHTPIGIVRSLAEDRDHEVWVSAISHRKTYLIGVKDGRVREELGPPTLPTVSRVVSDPRGGIWLVVSGVGLLRYYHARFENHPYDNAQFTWGAPLAESDGSVWMSASEGVRHLQNGRWRVLSDREGLPCN